jgi:hypothetical protein
MGWRETAKSDQIINSVFSGRESKAETEFGSGAAFSSRQGTRRGSKLAFRRFNMAYENCLNDCAYISEKLLDALLTGCVPVY